MSGRHHTTLGPPIVTERVPPGPLEASGLVIVAATADPNSTPSQNAVNLKYDGAIFADVEVSVLATATAEDQELNRSQPLRIDTKRQCS